MDTQAIAQLEKRLQETEDISEKIEIYIHLSTMLRTHDVDQALQMAYEAKALCEDEGDDANLARCLNILGSCFWYKADYNKSLHYLSKAIEVVKEINSTNLESKIYNNLGNVYKDLGNLGNAMQNYRKGFESAEKINDEETMAVLLKNISNLHIDLFEYDKALEFALKSKTVFEKNKGQIGLTSLYITLGNIYFKKENFNEALEYFYKCLELTDIDTQNNTLASSGIGKVYYKLKELHKAKNYLENALDIAKKFGHIETTIVALFYLAKIEYENKQYDNATLLLFEGLQLATQHNRKHDRMSIHEVLVNVYEKNGDYKNAYWHLTQFEKLKNEIFEKNKIDTLSNMRMSYELDMALKEKEIAQQTANLKQKFMANMSHEIRTPMNAIVGMTRLLIEKTHYPEQEKYLNAISRSADNLLVIINDILDLSKIEAGKIALENIPFYIEDILKDACEIQMHKAKEKKLDLSWHIESEVPKIIIGDPTRLSQVLLNLISNAVKFTEKGKVKVSVKVQKNLEGNKKLLRFEVSDTGIGISEEYVKKIFESFTQAGSDTARKFGGTGLGLTISKELVELMHGKITVRSKLNEGTNFRFEIPFNISDSSEIVWKKTDEEINQNDLNQLHNLKILLVEDNEFNRLLAEDTLKEFSGTIQVETAENGQEAIEKILQQNFDIVLMDIQMPVKDGVEATKEIRKLNSPKNDIKIIAMTANVFKEDIENYMAIGMNGYISKPFKKEDLAKAILLVLGNKEHNMFEIQEKPSVEIPLENKEYTDLTFLRSFTSNNTEKQKKYITMFLDNAPKLIADAQSNFDKNNYPEMKIAIHSLKSQLNYMGVKEPDSHVQELERATIDNTQHQKVPELFETLKKVCAKTFVELNLVLDTFVNN